MLGLGHFSSFYANTKYLVNSFRFEARGVRGLNSIALTLLDHSMRGAKQAVLMPITVNPCKSSASRAITARVFIRFTRTASRCDLHDAIFFSPPSLFRCLIFDEILKSFRVLRFS